MKMRFTEEQIIKALKKHNDSRQAADIVRELGVSEQTSYNWKCKYGDMNVSKSKRLKRLEAENARLKELVAELSLQDFKGCYLKKFVKPAAKRSECERIQKDFHISDRFAAGFWRYLAELRTTSQKTILKMKSSRNPCRLSLLAGSGLVTAVSI